MRTMKVGPSTIFLLNCLLLIGCGGATSTPHGLDVEKIVGKKPSLCKPIQYNGLSEDPVCYRLQERLVESSKAGDVDGIKEALENGANIEAGYYGSYPALYAASASGHKFAVLLLLDNGADPNRVMTFGQTALTAATSGGYKDIIGMLLEKGADVCLTKPNDDGRIIRALDTARENGNKEIEEMLIDAGARHCGWKALIAGERQE